jgi:cell wall-associated NlpC family hydrolase
MSKNLAPYLPAPKSSMAWAMVLVCGVLLACATQSAQAQANYSESGYTPALPSAASKDKSTEKSAEKAPDDMGKFLAEKGLVERLSDQVNAAGRAVSSRASDLVVHAMGFLGVPYKRGGNSFDQGFDCSGFVRAVYEQTIGLVLPRRAAEQAAATTPIEKTELQPGDLVFFNTLKATFSHVGIYVGDNKFIHSPRTGAVVRVEDMRVAYWQQRFDGARRVQASAKNSKVAAP